MTKQNHLLLLAFLVLILSLTSCISNKKHLEAVQQLKLEHDNVFNETTNTLKKEINQANDTISQLQLALAERKGENNILLLLRNELQQKIGDLEMQIENVSTSSQSSQQSLSGKLDEQKQEISRLKGLLQEVNAVLDEQTTRLSILSSDLNGALAGNNPSNYSITSSNNWVKLSMAESMIFKEKSTTRISEQGLYVLDKIAKIFSQNPGIQVDVIGHTDNSKPSKSYKNNWNVSVLRAASVADMLVSEYDVNANQITAGGKGEFSPLTSNETSEGRAANRRIEFLLTRGDADLIKIIKGVTAQM